MSRIVARVTYATPQALRGFARLYHIFGIHVLAGGLVVSMTRSTHKMRCYRNLNRGGYSLSVAGKVASHPAFQVLTGARCSVSAAGHARIVARRVRAVVAWIEGRDVGSIEMLPARAPDATAYYSPYRTGPYFVRADGTPIDSAEEFSFALLTPKFEVFLWK